MTDQFDAVVVGSGPNGLAAAITVARAGKSVLVLERSSHVGGAVCTDEVRPSVRRDRGAAVFPFAIGSPFLKDLPLEEHGLRWIVPEISFAHPLDGARAALSHRSLDITANGLGSDEVTYRRMVGRFSSSWPALSSDVLGPVAHVPRHPLLLAHFGWRGVRSAYALAKRFETEEARALIAGCAAHAVQPFKTPLSAGLSLLFLASSHAHGWPVPKGGANSVTLAMASYLRALGGEIRTDTDVTNLASVPPARAILFDTTPARLVAIAGDRLSPHYSAKALRLKHGPGVFKVDFLLDGPVPWASTGSGEASTVHVGGSFEQCARAEAAVAAGRHPEQPFVLVAQQGALDSSRSAGPEQLLWTYTHVPHGSGEDRSDAIVSQIERFAPGFRDRILDSFVTTPAALESSNPNLVGGDITGGAFTPRQVVARPRIFRPYNTSDPHLFLASASTPPGAGVHGMCGHRAALAALKSVLH